MQGKRERERHNKHKRGGGKVGMEGEEVRLDIEREEVEGREVYEAVCKGDMEALRSLEEREGQGKACEFEWDWNPLLGVMKMPEFRPRIAKLLLRYYGPEHLLLRARCAESGNTILQLAAQLKHQKLAILLLQFLPPDLDPWLRQSFLDAVNCAGQTVLHIATHNLLTDLVAELLKEERLKINIKDNLNSETAFDLITKQCNVYTNKEDLSKSRMIFKMLREAHAKTSKNLGKYEDEEDTIRKPKAAEVLVMDDDAWNLNINIIIVIATLAFTLIFAALFSIPQSLAPGDDDDNSTLVGLNIVSIQISDTKGDKVLDLQKSLSHNRPFSIFLCSLTIAGLFMVFVVLSLLTTITSNYSSRAIMVIFSWISFGIMGLSLNFAYVVAVYMYMGSSFTYILMACGIVVVFLHLFLAYYFDILSTMWEAYSDILKLALPHGCTTFFKNIC